MAHLELRDVRKSYGTVAIIHGVDLEVRDGEFVVFVGPSGCGKSTLLRMIAGLEDISGGDVKIDGAVVNRIPASERGLAMVFQSYALYPHMSVYKNMAFGLENMGLPTAEIEKRVNNAATLLRLTDYLPRKPKALSGGQRQRVAIGRAIVRNPKICLFDEPLSNLDAELRVAMRKELSALHADLGGTMIYVTHDQVEAMTLANRIVVLRAGRIEQVGAPLELYNRPDNLFVATFIGSPKMNVVEAIVASVNGNERRTVAAGRPQIAAVVRRRPAEDRAEGLVRDPSRTYRRRRRRRTGNERRSRRTTGRRDLFLRHRQRTAAIHHPRDRSGRPQPWRRGAVAPAPRLHPSFCRRWHGDPARRRRGKVPGLINLRPANSRKRSKCLKAIKHVTVSSAAA